MKSRHAILKGRKQTLSEKIVQLNEEAIKGQLKELVRGSVEETLIEMYLAGVSVRRVTFFDRRAEKQFAHKA